MRAPAHEALDEWLVKEAIGGCDEAWGVAIEVMRERRALDPELVRAIGVFVDQAQRYERQSMEKLHQRKRYSSQVAMEDRSPRLTHPAALIAEKRLRLAGLQLGKRKIGSRKNAVHVFWTRGEYHAAVQGEIPVLGPCICSRVGASEFVPLSIGQALHALQSDWLCRWCRRRLVDGRWILTWR